MYACAAGNKEFRRRPSRGATRASAAAPPPRRCEHQREYRRSSTLAKTGRCFGKPLSFAAFSNLSASLFAACACQEEWGLQNRNCAVV
ncbi:unnamed protein product, partial [Phaeothamnion confervicola]